MGFLRLLKKLLCCFPIKSHPTIDWDDSGDDSEWELDYYSTDARCGRSPVSIRLESYDTWAKGRYVSLSFSDSVSKRNTFVIA